MTRPFRFALGFVTLTVLAAFAAPRPAVAGSVTFAFNPTNLTVIEGNTITLDWTVTNNTGSAISIPGVGFNENLVSGDPDDILNSFSSLDGSCLGASLNAGLSCTISESISVSDFGQAENSDSAVLEFFTSVDYVCPNCFGDTDQVIGPAAFDFFAQSSTVLVTSADSGPTPEPSSLLLLGTGLLALGPFVRRSVIS